MVKTRQDAWSHEDDVLLAETVLKHIRDGSTQLKAFDEVGDILNRTSAACGFRWNAEVRDKYEDAVQLVKKQRKEKKRQIVAIAKSQQKAESASPLLKTEINYNVPLLSTKNLSLEDVISFLQSLQKDEGNSRDYLTLENRRLIEEHETLQNDYDCLKEKYEKLLEQQASVQEDYHSLMNIMNRARKMVLFEEETSLPTTMAPIFQMDQNGNIEIVGP